MMMMMMTTMTMDFDVDGYDADEHTNGDGEKDDHDYDAAQDGLWLSKRLWDVRLSLKYHKVWDQKEYVHIRRRRYQ